MLSGRHHTADAQPETQQRGARAARHPGHPGHPGQHVGDVAIEPSAFESTMFEATMRVELELQLTRTRTPIPTLTPTPTLTLSQTLTPTPNLTLTLTLTLTQTQTQTLAGAHRVMMSSRATNMACPMCSLPVTLGGGIEMTKHSLSEPSIGLK